MTKTLVATPDPEPPKPPQHMIVMTTKGTTMTFPATWTLGQVSTVVTYPGGPWRVFE